MAKHRKATKRAPAVKTNGALLGATAAGLASVLVFGHATDNATLIPQVQLAAATSYIGIGGRGDPLSANIPAKINHSLVPPGCDGCYQGVAYPAGFDIDNSVAAGLPVLHADLQAAAANNSPVLVIGYSEGALVAEREKRNLATNPGNATPGNVKFALIASANLPNGGIFSRFPGVNLYIVSSNGPAEPSQYDTTYYTNEYDTYADFPAYFNVLSLLNSLAAVWYVHPDAYYDTIDLDPAPAGPAITKVVPHATGGGSDTYVFVLADHLPLFAPVRQLSSALGTTAFTEPLLSAIEPLVRVLVDMGYTDRENLNPEVPTTFSWIIPASKVDEALAAIPAALAQGQANFNQEISHAAPSSTTVTPTVAPNKSVTLAPALQPKAAPEPTPQPKLKDTSPADDPGAPLTRVAPLSPLAKKDPILGKTKQSPTSTDNVKLFAPRANGSTATADATPVGTPGKQDSSTSAAPSGGGLPATPGAGPKAETKKAG